MRLRNPDILTPTMPDLRSLMDRGMRARALMDTLCWKHDLSPFIEKRLLKAKSDSVWRPGQGLSNCEAVALGCSRQGGVVDTWEELRKTLKSWVKQGESAKEKLIKLERGAR